MAKSIGSTWLFQGMHERQFTSCTVLADANHGQPNLGSVRCPGSLPPAGVIVGFSQVDIDMTDGLICKEQEN
jgi:hypothetical protein